MKSDGIALKYTIQFFEHVDQENWWMDNDDFLIKWRCLIKEVIKFGCHYFKDQFWAAHAYDETMNILYYWIHSNVVTNMSSCINYNIHSILSSDGCAGPPPPQIWEKPDVWGCVGNKIFGTSGYPDTKGLRKRVSGTRGPRHLGFPESMCLRKPRFLGFRNPRVSGYQKSPETLV